MSHANEPESDMIFPIITITIYHDPSKSNKHPSFIHSFTIIAIIITMIIPFFQPQPCPAMAGPTTLTTTDKVSVWSTNNNSKNGEKIEEINLAAYADLRDGVRTSSGTPAPATISTFSEMSPSHSSVYSRVSGSLVSHSASPDSDTGPFVQISLGGWSIA